MRPHNQRSSQATKMTVIQAFTTALLLVTCLTLICVHGDDDHTSADADASPPDNTTREAEAGDGDDHTSADTDASHPDNTTHEADADAGDKIIPATDFFYGSRQFWLYLSSSVALVDDAKAHCKSLGARLAVLDTEEKAIEAKLVIEARDGLNLRNYWVGAVEVVTGEDTTRTFKWINQSPVIGNWCKDQPDKPEEHCVLIEHRADHHCMHDYPCNEAFNYICERVCTSK